MPYSHQLTIPGAADAQAQAGKRLVDLHLVDAAEMFAKASKAKRTREAYSYHWRQFVAWCAERQVGAIPCAPETLAVYLTHLAQAGTRVAGIELVLTSISQAHKTQGLRELARAVRVESGRFRQRRKFAR